MKTSIKNKIQNVLALLFGLMFINAGLDKFFHYMPMPTDLSPKMASTFQAFIQIVWLMPLVGFAELVGGILFIIPKTRALGAIVVFPVIIGILLTNTITDRSGLPIALVFLAINLWVIYDNREKYMPMIK